MKTDTGDQWQTSIIMAQHRRICPLHYRIDDGDPSWAIMKSHHNIEIFLQRSLDEKTTTLNELGT